MKYTIRELNAFSVIGQEAELTHYQKRNFDEYQVLKEV